MLVALLPTIVFAASPDLSEQIVVAARIGKSDELIRLIEDGAQVDTKDNRSLNEVFHDDLPGATPLIYAAFHGDVKLVQWLLAKGANPNAISKDGETALWAAATLGCAELVELLIKSGAKQQSWPSPIIAATHADSIEALNILLSSRGNIDAVGFISSSSQPTTGLAQASAYGSSEMVALLVKRGANVNLEPRLNGRTGETPLTAAIGKNKTENAQVLLAAGADVNKRGYDFMAGSNVTPLEIAVSNRNLDTLRLLLSHEVNKLSVSDAMKRAKNNWNGVQAVDAEIISMLGKANPQK